MNKLVVIFALVALCIVTSEAAPSIVSLAVDWSKAKQTVDDMQTNCANIFRTVGLLASGENSAVGSSITSKLNSALNTISNTLQPTYTAISSQTLTVTQATQQIRLLKTDLDGASVAILGDVNRLDPMLGNGIRIYEMMKSNADTIDRKANELYTTLRG